MNVYLSFRLTWFIILNVNKYYTKVTHGNINYGEISYGTMIYYGEKFSSLDMMLFIYICIHKLQEIYFEVSFKWIQIRYSKYNFNDFIYTYEA